MPQFSDLRSVYPLNFTSFGSLDIDALKHTAGAIVSPADSVNFQSLLDGIWCGSWISDRSDLSHSLDVPDSNDNRRCLPPERRTHLLAQGLGHPTQCVTV